MSASHIRGLKCVINNDAAGLLALIRTGDLNVAHNRCGSFISRAAEAGNFKILKILIDHNISLNCSEASNALAMAALNNFDDIVNLLIENRTLYSAPEVVLTSTINNGNRGTTKRLLDYFNTDFKGSDNFVLKRAILDDRYELVDLLLERYTTPIADNKIKSALLGKLDRLNVDFEGLERIFGSDSTFQSYREESKIQHKIRTPT